MHNQPSPHIDQATIDRWQADGAVLLKGVFTPWVERLAEGVTALMASPSEYGHARTVIPKDGSPPFFRITATGRGSRRLASLSSSRPPPKSPRR